jgi:hypothetical protein
MYSLPSAERKMLEKAKNLTMDIVKNTPAINGTGHLVRVFQNLKKILEIEFSKLIQTMLNKQPPLKIKRIIFLSQLVGLIYCIPCENKKECQSKIDELMLEIESKTEYSNIRYDVYQISKNISLKREIVYGKGNWSKLMSYSDIIIRDYASDAIKLDDLGEIGFWRLRHLIKHQTPNISEAACLQKIKDRVKNELFNLGKYLVTDAAIKMGEPKIKGLHDAIERHTNIVMKQVKTFE